MADTDKQIRIAKIAEQAERYDDMIECMKKVVKQKAQLTNEERNMLSVAFKNVVSSKRLAWRVVSSIQSDYKRSGNSRDLEAADEYKGNLTKELEDVCKEMIKLLDDILIENATDDESKVLYYKMKGDCHKYLAEVANSDDTKDMEKAEKHYKDAYDEATKLSGINPTRLGLALNISVFYYEMLNKRDIALRLAKEGFDNAIGRLNAFTGDYDDPDYRESTLLVQLLRDKMTLWSAED